MGTLFVGETNKAFNVASGGYDMSSYTELSLIFTKPDGTSVTKTTSDGVVIGIGLTSDPDLGTVAANEHVTLPIPVGFLDQAGTWCVYLKYTNTGTTPDTVLIGAPTQFTVLDITC